MARSDAIRAAQFFNNPVRQLSDAQNSHLKALVDFVFQTVPHEEICQNEECLICDRINNPYDYTEK